MHLSVCVPECSPRYPGRFFWDMREQLCTRGLTDWPQQWCNSRECQISVSKSHNITCDVIRLWRCCFGRAWPSLTTPFDLIGTSLQLQCGLSGSLLFFYPSSLSMYWPWPLLTISPSRHLDMAGYHGYQPYLSFLSILWILVHPLLRPFLSVWGVDKLKTTLWGAFKKRILLQGSVCNYMFAWVTEA